MTRILAVRLDGIGDVLLCGPAVRALAHGADQVDLLTSPAARGAAALLPGVTRVHTFSAAWCDPRTTSFDRDDVADLIRRLSRESYDAAVIFTSFHQSPLPTAMVCRMAGIPHVVGTSDDYPGALLDVRHRRLAVGDDGGTHGGGHEVEAGLRLAEAAGYALPPQDDGRLRLTPATHETSASAEPYVVVHPGASVPARAIPDALADRLPVALGRSGWDVVVTGGLSDRAPAHDVGAVSYRNLIGATTISQLAEVLRRASAVVVGNTGAAHLAAAVGTPVVSLFSPVVPVERWRPWGVPTVVLGDQSAPCAGSRARTCPVPGHPCLTSVSVEDVVQAVATLAGSPASEAGVRCAC
ncbi:glycosyltransferase family 9 protein [Segeticoccus rhizosphaerae]|jgi:ADP-heptose:LPS heptosyltransferase|uniref:glycosyltransferase family 9 protein n=2 Tax=Segeticoccus rhizosphaerae TaxID=1104777 RepID=UPI0010C025FB|nr:glycosyltransferase family 9 protein [Ornithinicoccus soli]